METDTVNPLGRSEVEAYWKAAFPETWPRLVELSIPFYENRLIKFTPLRSTALSELREAISFIQVGKSGRTPGGKRLDPRARTPASFDECVSGFSSMWTDDGSSCCYTFDTILSWHIGPYMKDILPRFRQAFSGQLTTLEDPKSKRFDLHRRVYDNFDDSLRAAGIYDRLSDLARTFFAGAIRTILFDAMHFASVGDDRRDFVPLLNFFRAGNLPIGLVPDVARRRVTKDLLFLCPPAGRGE